MGHKTWLIIISHLICPDAYEFYYSEHREEGVEYLREYCQDKVHLKVPKQVRQGPVCFIPVGIGLDELQMGSHLGLFELFIFIGCLL